MKKIFNMLIVLIISLISLVGCKNEEKINEEKIKGEIIFEIIDNKGGTYFTVNDNDYCYKEITVVGPEISREIYKATKLVQYDNYFEITYWYQYSVIDNVNHTSWWEVSHPTKIYSNSIAGYYFTK